MSTTTRTFLVQIDTGEADAFSSLDLFDAIRQADPTAAVRIKRLEGVALTGKSWSVEASSRR